MILGASVLLRQEGRLLFEVQKPAKWTHAPGGEFIIGIGCIGGRVELGESALEALQREALEEIGCTVLLDTPGSPFFMGPDGSVRMLDPRETREVEEGILFLWEGSGPDLIKGGQVAVFSGTAQGHPRPVGLPAIIGLDLETLFECRACGLTVGEVLDRGAILMERQAVPRNARLAPVDTAKVVVALPEEFKRRVRRR
ncbi:MAG: NUDIX domain-containing protein [bacterium]|nr:NUDIX domain-containing protein [bacterium]